MARILLLGAGGNAGQNFTKCIKAVVDQDGNSIHTVIGADPNQYFLAASNIDEAIQLDYTNEQTKFNSLCTAIEKHQIDIIHAQPDPEVEFLLKYKQYWSDKIFDHDIITWNRFRDKTYCQNIWGQNIKEYFVIRWSQMLALDNKHRQKLFMDIAKKGHGKVWVRAHIGAGSKAALPVEHIGQATDWINYWVVTKGMKETDFSLCQYLPGREYAVQTFWLNGELVHSGARERLAYFFGSQMPSGQSSTPSIAQTINNKHVYKNAYQAIKAIDSKPHGIYCVDLKEDLDSDPIPTEVNYGRFFTTSDFFATVGMNTPMEYINSMLINDNYELVYPLTPSIEAIEENQIWVRGLDREPKLLFKRTLTEKEMREAFKKAKEKISNAS